MAKRQSADTARLSDEEWVAWMLLWLREILEGLDAEIEAGAE